MSNDITISLREPHLEYAWDEYLRSGMPEMIGNFNLCLGLLALVQSGVIAKLRRGGGQTAVVLLDGVDFHIGSHLLNYLAVHGLVVRIKDRYSMTSKGFRLTHDVALAQLGFFVEAYGNVVGNAGALLMRKLTYGKDISRDGRSLGAHCATLFHTFHTATILEILKNAETKYILDLGCGGGQFLVDACQRDPQLLGIGLDISEPAIDFARELALSSGLSDRLKFYVADAFVPSSWPKDCLSADVICAVGVVHEHFREGEQAVIAILNTYKELMKNGVKHFILGEPELRYDLNLNDPDLYFIHILTAQGFPRSREQWLALFPQTSFTCRQVFARPDAGPRFNFFDLVLK